MPEQELDKKTEPKTETLPELDGIGSLEKTALDMEECSVIDLSIKEDNQYNPKKLGNPKKVFVYIRPLGSDIEKLLKEGQEKISYIFRGVNSNNLKNRFEKATNGIKSLDFKTINGDVFNYKYDLSYKQILYHRVKILAG